MYPTQFTQLSNLIGIPRQQTIISEPDPDTIDLALVNVSSLADKSFLINDFITDHKLDAMFLTETWLDDNKRAAALIEPAPPNFIFLDVVRAGRRGGGIAIIFKDVLLFRQLY